MGRVLSLDSRSIFHFFTLGHFPHPFMWGQPDTLRKSRTETSGSSQVPVADPNSRTAVWQVNHSHWPASYFFYKIVWFGATRMVPKYSLMVTLTHIRHRMRSDLLATNGLSLTCEVEPVCEPMCYLLSSVFPPQCYLFSTASSDGGVVVGSLYFIHTLPVSSTHCRTYTKCLVIFLVPVSVSS